MDRLFAILLLLAAATTAGCKKSGEQASKGPPLTLDVLQKMLPETLAGLPRQLVVPTPEIPQLSAYYQDAGNTRSGHVTYTILTDTPRTLKNYEGRFRERASIGGHTAYTRQYQPKTAPETAEGCLVLGDKISVCVDLAPATIGDLTPLFHQLPLAELEKRAR
jgi:hypothetical protein